MCPWGTWRGAIAEGGGDARSAGEGASERSDVVTYPSTSTTACNYVSGGERVEVKLNSTQPRPSHGPSPRVTKRDGKPAVVRMVHVYVGSTGVPSTWTQPRLTTYSAVNGETRVPVGFETPQATASQYFGKVRAFGEIVV